MILCILNKPCFILPVIDIRLLGLFAQVIYERYCFNFKKVLTMKKIIYLAVLLTGLAATAATPPEISEKVLKAFKETFTTAENVTWEELENKITRLILRKMKLQ